jgi:triacylglycerol lipase
MRTLLALFILLVVAPLGAQAPIVFVHGNGDHAGLWDTTIWRFESNEWPADRLFAVDLPHPSASARYTVREHNRSTPEDQTAALAAFVTRVLLETGESRVILVGSSRGGMTIRNYLRFGGGAAHVSHAILGGTPNHGAFALTQLQPDGEFNGAAPYLTRLNAGREVVDGVSFLTIRSDRNDKYAQADGAALGMPGVQTGVDARGPALEGAEDVVLPGADHREVAFSPEAFVAMYRFLTGRIPDRSIARADSVSVLEGLVSGTVNGAPTNLPLPGAHVSVYPVNAATGAREGAAAFEQTVDFDGRWGPFRANPAQPYEFVITAPDSAVFMHVFRSSIPRSSRYVNFRLPAASGTRGDSVSVVLVRPRGYLGAGRDTVTVDGAPARGIPPGVPTLDRLIIRRAAGNPESVTFRFNQEVLTVQTRGSDPRRLIMAEILRDDH